MITFNDFARQQDKSLLVKHYHAGRCYAVRLAPGTDVFAAIEVGNKFGYDYEPFNESTGEFLPGKSRHIKG